MADFDKEHEKDSEPHDHDFEKDGIWVPTNTPVKKREKCYIDRYLDQVTGFENKTTKDCN